ncbi:MAG: efflux RND transporter periplasmic adaptor subunit [Thermoguttaceae bacterium]|jgi:RND family efflux transporter MFP subunit|nr:efflux RND transporter periplasmic adaptor subunit [Thermoguttaceae bacterium]
MRVPARPEGLAAAFVMALVAGCGPAVVGPEPSPPKVAVSHPVIRELVDEDDYRGWLQASQTVEVRSRVRGHIKRIHFTDGQIVEKNQLLFELDPRPFQVMIDEALAQAKALEAQKYAAAKERERYRELVQKRAVSQQEFEKVEADVLSYDARIAAKMQEVERFRLDLEYSRVTAEIGGRIGRAQLTEGNLVNAGGSDPVLTTIVALDPLYVYFSVDERSLQRYQKSRRAHLGDKAAAPVREEKVPFRFGLDTDEGYPHQGLLDFADNKVDPSTGTIEVRGVVQDPKRLLTPGSRVRVRIPVSDKYPATLVPDTAVNTDQDRKYLLVVDEKNVVQRRNVRLGRLLDDGMRIVLGAEPELKPDEWIIVEGIQRARLLYPVEPVPQEPARSAALREETEVRR